MEERHCSFSTQGVKRVWEASITSLKSKKVKGSHPIDYQTCNQSFVPDSIRNDSCLQSLSFDASNDKFLRGFCKDSSITNSEEKTLKELGQAKEQSKALQGKRFAIRLMNIADEDKQNQLTKVIKDLGGSVPSDGSTITHCNRQSEKNTKFLLCFMYRSLDSLTLINADLLMNCPTY